MQLPGPVRAVVGLLATAADEAKHLPDRAIELPMLAVSSALQMSLRAQQRYARLAARGDDIINRRPPGEEPPPWATFDEPVSADEVRAATELLDDLLGPATRDQHPGGGQVGESSAREMAPVTDLPARKATKSADRAVVPTAKKAVAKKPVEKKAVAKKAVAKKPAAKKTPAKNAAVDAPPPIKGKTINQPRHASPSRFDTVGDD
jgi:hypothetical protein